ncbi:hypothetical protein DXG03_004531 [Asterophora parasitica]|uniref:Uncharacterized protein n=1 Tax=Asterophora parasitica TaxID=117018 RepID=A0A9P7G705_9AGAR|nr:hypothetical protein DXG03_004531 [Asterophora parasitica]
MKTSTIAPAVLACLVSLALTNAGPIPASSHLSSRSQVDASVDALYIRDIEAEIIARAAELEARGGTFSKDKKKKDKDSKALYSVGSNKSESPTGEFRKYTAGRHDDYFADWQTMTGGKGKSGVDNPAAGKGKKAGGKRDLSDFELEMRGGTFSKDKKKKDKDSKALYSVGSNKSESPTGEFRKYTAGRHDDYFADWQTMTGGKGKSGVDNPAAGKGKKAGGKRDLSEFELEVRDLYDALDARDLWEAELEARDFEAELEARDLLEAELEARDFFESELEARDFLAELEARDFIDELD